MSLPSGEDLIAGSEKVAEFFQNAVDENGKLKEGDFTDDVSSVYKLPTFLFTAGRWELCHKVHHGTPASNLAIETLYFTCTYKLYKFYTHTHRHTHTHIDTHTHTHT